ncbi:MAG: ribonuclease III family protein [Candidatus Bathyarchaeales archaeon]
MEKESKPLSFAKVYRDLTEVLMDHKLAALGDAYINFAYSLALSKNRGQPSGAKVRGSVLAEAFKKAGLREYMPSRVSRHMLADAAEALTVYAWLHSYLTLEESVAMLEKTKNPVEGFTKLLLTIKDRVKF